VVNSSDKNTNTNKSNVKLTPEKNEPVKPAYVSINEDEAPPVPPKKK